MRIVWDDYLKDKMDIYLDTADYSKLFHKEQEVAPGRLLTILHDLLKILADDPDLYAGFAKGYYWDDSVECFNVLMYAVNDLKKDKQ